MRRGSVAAGGGGQCAGVPKIIASIPGAKLVQKQRRFRLSGRDDFCEFVVDDKTFLVIEPFGDNDRFIVVAEPPEPEGPRISEVRDAFQRYRALFGPFDGQQSLERP